MLVEDESIIARDIENILLNYGFEVVGIFSKAEDAIEKVVELNPDLILMDIVLKGQIDGIEAAQKIYEKIQVPIIYLTAYADEDTIKRIVNTVPYGYFLKPFEEKELYTWIQTTLSKFEKDKRLKRDLRTLDEDLRKIEYLASHDLQEPLRMIASYVRLLQKKYSGKLDSEADEFIKYTVDGANRMRSLINDLLDYSRIRRDNFKLEKTDVAELALEVIRGLEKELRNRRVDSAVEKLPELVADRTHLKTLFYHIIHKLISEYPEELIYLKLSGSENLNYAFYTVSVSDSDKNGFVEQNPEFPSDNNGQENKKNEFWFSLCMKILGFYNGNIWLSPDSQKNKVIKFKVQRYGAYTAN